VWPSPRAGEGHTSARARVGPAGGRPAFVVDHVKGAEDVPLHLRAGGGGVAIHQGAVDGLVVGVSGVERAAERLGGADGVDQEVAEVPHPQAHVLDHIRPRHAVDEAVELAVEHPVAVCPGLGVVLVAQPADAGVHVVQVRQVGISAATGCDTGDRTLEGGEQREEVADLLRVVARHSAADLRDDLDQPVGLQPAQGVHDRLLADPQL
jgi:hypothetical protein